MLVVAPKGKNSKNSHVNDWEGYDPPTNSRLVHQPPHCNRGCDM